MPDQALATGRRKRSIARVRVLPGDGTITVNGLPIERYITSLVQRVKILDPLRVSGVQGSYNVVARVEGGGSTGQAGALRLGIAPAVVVIDPHHPRPPQKARPPTPGPPLQ